VKRLLKGHADFPARLLRVDKLDAITTTGSLEAGVRVAIVGTRKPRPETKAFAFALASKIASCGGVVISGGAHGIDSAAHEGALAAGGRTWLVAPVGVGEVFPDDHQDLFNRVAASAGAVVYPFEDGHLASRPSFLKRNKVIAALADALVIVQAGVPSGALNAAKEARKLRCPVWVVPPVPWLNERSEFLGSQAVLDLGARPLYTVGALLKEAGLDPVSNKNGPLFAEDARRLLNVATIEPKHVDELASLAGVLAPSAATALLTLTLEDVVVEGPPGFFRRVNLK